MAPPSERISSAGRTRSKVWRVVPWLVTFAALGYILATTDLPQLLDAVSRADWMLFWGSMFGLYLLVFAIDSVATWWLYRRFHVPDMRIRDVLPARGATYILGIINYGAGIAAMALYFKRRFGVGIVEGGASLLVLMAVDVGLLILAILAGSPWVPEEWLPTIMLVGAAFALGTIAHLVFWRAPWSWGPLERLRQSESFKGFREARIVDYATLAIIRAPVIAVYTAMHFATLRAFDIVIPVTTLLVYVPMQMIVAALPISVSGMGTVQLVQRELYGPFAESIEHVDAYALALLFGFTLPRIVIGLASLRAASRALEAVPDVEIEAPERREDP